MSGLSHLTGPGPSLYTVPPGTPFLPAIARTLLGAYADDPVGLSDVTLYLPSRRAKREVAAAFLAEKPGEMALLMPQLRALGDVDEEDLLAGGAPLDAEAALPPPADGLERRLVLARFLRRAREAAREPLPGWPAALTGADELARVLDEFHTEGVCLSKLAGLVTDEDLPQGAVHWEKALRFLSVITEVWPAWTAQQGRMDGAERRRRLVEAMAEALDALPEPAPEAAPRGPIIVAGSLGTVPATARFMRRVAEHERGLVVLPGVDLTLDAEAWAKIEPPHPQALFNTLLKRHFRDAETDEPLSRDAIKPWPGTSDTPSDRAAFLTLALRPAEATSDWHDRLHAFGKEHDAAEATRGLHLVTAEGEDEEAGFLALLMRETLAEPGKTCTLVTPDRNLARRVRGKLRLWGVEVDDSGGVPLAGTYRGTFMRAVARWLCDPSDPVAISEVCGHPLCRIGQRAADHERDARALNRCLRGARPGPGFEGLRGLIGAPGFRPTGRGKDTTTNALALIDRLEAAAGPFLAARGGPAQLQAHVEVAQRLADAAREPGEARLWRYEDGEGLAILVADLLAQANLLPDDGCDYADLFDALVAGPVVRKRGGHPRLAILGLLEARLQHADRMILAGLNEGVWPAEPRTDAFLSRPMRDALGLPSPEMVVGRTAHDFSQMAAAPEVYLTRALRQGTKPAEASRWLVRLSSFVEAVGRRDACDDAPRLRAMLAALHRHDGPVAPAPAPRPVPPMSARPKSFSVSEIGKLLRDPYAVYARHVLNLPALDPMTSEINAAEKGNFYHEVFARYAVRWPDPHVAPPDPVRALTEIAEGLMDERAMPAAARALWRPRLKVGFETFAVFDQEARARGGEANPEIAATWTFSRGGETYEIRARADRIDIGEDGRAAVVDYKTGTLPSLAQATSGFSPQVLLTAIMLREGAFESAVRQDETGQTPVSIPAGTASWGGGFLAMLPNEAPDALMKPSGAFATDVPHGTKTKKTFADHVEDAERGFYALLDHYAAPDTAFPSQPRRQYKDDYGAYDHLARRGEWAASEGEE